ncbi:MAG: hypothetical protein CL477_12985 [Acidobacteria bacterium]|jgi:cell division septation protein DedD|nr:hypothetical protein [Acidobacteriota bacterium]MDP7480680.1 SPOR domain-containing protein [Vicinamibacterales bacterium]MDP7690553.1 SPOR domain-containing protein [Vicinamibacterales bacterium]HJN43632.1 SPOR domain-containing protein [Vicinamibacterales bacterium]|tara:strand:+ start:14047 stop:14673 length:627 start_codon:yes stop_codon:yes gene_type:complete
MANTGQSEAAPSAKQLVFLAMIATVVAVIVFLCGVLVGRGVPGRRMAPMTATEAESGGAGIVGLGVPEVALDPDAETGSPLDALTYFDLLRGAEPASEPPATPADASTSESALEPDATSPAQASLEDAGAAASFVLQVTALRSGDDASTIAADLVAKGYPAFVVDPSPGAPVAVYRVRVGPYVDQGEAETVRHLLETEEQFNPWVIQP